MKPDDTMTGASGIMKSALLLSTSERVAKCTRHDAPASVGYWRGLQLKLALELITELHIEPINRDPAFLRDLWEQDLGTVRAFIVAGSARAEADYRTGARERLARRAARHHTKATSK